MFNRSERYTQRALIQTNKHFAPPQEHLACKWTDTVLPNPTEQNFLSQMRHGRLTACLFPSLQSVILLMTSAVERRSPPSIGLSSAMRVVLLTSSVFCTVVAPPAQSSPHDRWPSHHPRNGLFGDTDKTTEWSLLWVVFRSQYVVPI